MNSKKPLPSVQSYNATKFVASQPLDVVMRVLNNSPRLDLELIKFHPNHCDYRISFEDDPRDIPIFVLMQRWNKTETLVTLEYYRRTKLGIVSPLLILAFLLSTVVIYALGAIGIVTQQLSFLLICGAVVLFLCALVIVFLMISDNRELNTGKDISNKSNTYTFDSDGVRTQEDLMHFIIKELNNSSELNIVEKH